MNCDVKLNCDVLQCKTTIIVQEQETFANFTANFKICESFMGNFTVSLSIMLRLVVGNDVDLVRSQ